MLLCFFKYIVWDKRHSTGFENATNFKKTPRTPRTCSKCVVLSWWEEITDTYFCFSCSWLADPSMCNTQMLQLFKKKKKPKCVWKRVHSILMYTVGNKNRLLSALKGVSCLWLATKFERCDGLNLEFNWVKVE